MKAKKLLAVLLALCMTIALVAACGSEEPAPAPAPEEPAAPEAPAEPAAPAADPADPNANPWEGVLLRDPFVAPPAATSVPREETVYWNGFMWGSPVGWNAFSPDMNNPLAISQDADGARLAMLETPYMYNMLDNKMYPLLADGGVDGYVWNDDKSELSYKIKPAACWSDGTKVTAYDAEFTWKAGVEYGATKNAGWTPYIADVVAADHETVVIKLQMTEYNGETVPVFANRVIQFLGQNYIMQKAWLENLIDRNGGDTAAIIADTAEDIVFSGPYAPYFLDDTKVVLVRDDGYWGQDASLWGKLPTPKYLSNVNYETNAAGDSVFVTGDVDISQQFIGNVQNLWLEQGLPISTYYPDAPYHISATMPTAWFNMNSPKPGIDIPEVRRAIAMAVDYDAVIANAMTGQSPTFAEIPRSLMNPTAAEQAMYDKAAVAHLQWTGNDIEGANALLDSVGIVDSDGSGYRDIDGVDLAFNACCPEGWSDWNASMEIVAAAGQAIGINIETFFPSWDVYQTVYTKAVQDEYDIFMQSPPGIAYTAPYGRILGLLGDDFKGVDNNWDQNFGQWFNDEALDLIKRIPLESDDAELKAIYTRLVEIYLTEVPSFSLMYRPEKFHTVNETYWTGFTEAGDGRNVPPVNCITGYAIADLYNLQPVG